MDIAFADQHAYLLEERLSVEEIRQRAMDRRAGAFGSGIGSILQRPKADDIELVASQRRLEPFWHVEAHARYVYDRSRTYTIAASAAEVRDVTVHGMEQPISGGSFSLPTIEHCREELAGTLYVDGATGEPSPDGASIVTGPKREITDFAALEENDTVVLPPEQRASYVVRQLLGTMMKPIHADTLNEESLSVDHVDLYYRPWWAFEFRWKPKEKTAVVELDAISGEMRPGQALTARVSKMVSRDALFDIGADTVGLLVPGGSIAVKVAKMAIDKTEKPAS
jgi:hypothetical protein